MNTDIRLSVLFFDHPKTIKLRRRLGFDGIESLIRLWCWAAQNKPDGNLSCFDVDDIEIAARWNGSPGDLVKCLVDLRWLDDDDGMMSLHDWREHNSWAAEAEERGNKSRLSRLARINRDLYDKLTKAGYTSLTRDEYEHLTTVERPLTSALSPAPSPAPVPSPSPLPSPKEKALCGEPPHDTFLSKKKRTLSGKRLETFNLFWDAFAYKKGKAEAADAWLDLPPLTDAIVEQIVAAAKVEAAGRQEKIDKGQTPKMAQGWLSGRRWEDEGEESTTSGRRTGVIINGQEVIM